MEQVVEVAGECLVFNDHSMTQIIPDVVFFLFSLKLGEMRYNILRALPFQTSKFIMEVIWAEIIID